MPARDKVLVAAERDARNSLKSVLAESGFEVIVAEATDAIWEQIVFERPALVILFVSMPQLKVSDLVMRVRRDPCLGAVKVIAVGVDSEDAILAGEADLCLGAVPPVAVLSDLARSLLRQRRRADEQLEEVSHRLSAMLESITDPIFTVDREWRFTFVNRQTEEFFGRSRGTLLGKELWSECRAVENTVFKREFYRAVAQNCPVSFETFYQPLERWIEVNAYPSGQGLTVSFRDVTLQHEDREALRQSEYRFAKVFNSSPAAICINTVKDGRYIEVNDRYCKLFGYTREELLASSVTALNMWTDPEEREPVMRRLMEEGAVRDVEAKFRTRSGRCCDLLLSVERIELAGETEPVLIALITDITERKQMEQRFLRAQRLESIGTLAGGIAHDLNNLLAPIVMGVDLLRMFNPSPDGLRVIDDMAQSARRGTELVKQVLSFARGVSGARVVVQLEPIVSEIESFVRNTFPKNVDFEVLVSNDLWSIIGDPTQLHQVLLNLCLNARDAMPNGGSLKLSVRNIVLDCEEGENQGTRGGRYVLVEVADNGVGMSRGVASRVFEPFFTTKKHGEGTGLGLSTVAGIARGHGGVANVYSEPGKGSVFKVYLPACERVSLPVVEESIVESLPRGNGETILLVDDEISILNVTSYTLESFGYRVLTATNGQKAMDVFREHRNGISLVLTDMMMPGMDGAALIDALHEADPTLRIVASSGLTSDGKIPKAVERGVEHCLPKPFERSSLLRVVREALQSKQRAAE